MTCHTLLPKTDRTGERGYLKSFRDTACEACGATGTVVAAHFNMNRAGMKNPGVVAGLCHDCHAVADRRFNVSKVEAQRVWLRVLRKLLRERFEEFKR